MINIGQSLKEHREKAGLTQEELAEKAHVDQSKISRWESNIFLPKITDCLKLAAFYGISIDYLIGYENEDGTKNDVNLGE